MAIAALPTVFKSFTFGGESSADYGVQILGEGVFNAPERAVELVSVPGRNGSIAIDQGYWENIEVTYPAVLIASNPEEFATAMANFRNMLCSKRGYCRLSDDYHPGEYRMAMFNNDIEVDEKVLRGGEFDITFNCKPQRWLTSGEVPVTIGEWGATKEASGEIVTIESEGGEAAKSLVITLEPIQSGSGDPSPTNVRPISGRTEVVTRVAGKNLLPIIERTATTVGVTATVNADGSVTLNGTATGNGGILLTESISGKWLTEGTYYGKLFGNNLEGLSFQAYNNGFAVMTRPSGSFVIPSGSETNYMRVRWARGTVFDNVTVYPMLTIGTTEPTTYIAPQTETETTSLGRTVYGGTLDLVSGELTVTHGFAEYDGSSDESWTGANTQFAITPSGIYSSGRGRGEIISNEFIYSASATSVGTIFLLQSSGQVYVYPPVYDSLANFKSWLSSHPIQVVYPLATPQTYQLTPQQIELLVGENHVWSDGSITMQYGDDPNSLWNPTQYDAGPLLAIEGNGTVQLGQSRLDVSDGILGTYVVAENHQFVTTVRYWGSSLEIDPYFNSGDKFSLGKVEVTELIEDKNGNIFTEVSNISLSEGTSVSFEGNTLRIRTVFDYGEFTVGSGYTTRSREISFDVKNASGKIDTATFGIGFTYSNLGDLFVSGYITSVLPASGSTGFDFSANYLYSSVVAKKISGFSTLSVGSLTKYVDCETGESYVMLGDRIISNNRNISLPVDLPVLTSGANAISFSNTITDLKITPRWWKL